jgi:hypothetical protein
MLSVIQRYYRFAAVLAVAGALASAPHARAAVVTTSLPVTVGQAYAYTEYGGGDFVFSTIIAAPGCGNGWYIKAGDPGFKTAVATVLLAQASALQILVYGDNSDIWTGSPSGQYCRVTTVGISP